jgi:hypothetical protein
MSSKTLKKYFSYKYIFIYLTLLSVISISALLSPSKSSLPIEKKSPAILFKNVNLILHNRQTELVQGMSLLIHDGLIHSFGRSDRFNVPEGLSVRKIDLENITIMPGLIDSHVHIWEQTELASYLSYGITGVRNMSAMPFHSKLIERVKSRSIIGPEIITSSPILNSSGPNESANHVLIETSEQANKVVRKLLNEGHHTIKVYSNLKRDPYNEILKLSKKYNLKLTGHTPEGVRSTRIKSTKDFSIPFEESLIHNFESIEHIESIVWHALAGKHDEQKMIDVAKKISASKIPITTTLVAHRNLINFSIFNMHEKSIRLDSINPFLKEIDKGTYEFWGQQRNGEREKKNAFFYLKAARILFDQGVRLLAGSDAGIFVNSPGLSLIDEMNLLAKAGIPNHAIINMATHNPAVSLGFKNVGAIKKGYRANLVILSDNPLDSFETLKDPLGLIIGGQWLDQSKLKFLRSFGKKQPMLKSIVNALEMFWRQYFYLN